MSYNCAVFVGFMEFQYVLLPLVLLSGIQCYPRLTLLALCRTTVLCLLVVSGIHCSPIECSSQRLTLCIACLLYMAFMAFITCKRSQYIDVVLCLLASWNLNFPSKFKTVRASKWQIFKKGRWQERHCQKLVLPNANITRLLSTVGEWGAVGMVLRKPVPFLFHTSGISQPSRIGS